MKCPKCGSAWMYWKNLGKLNAYQYCTDCGKEQYSQQALEENEEDETDEV